MAHANLPDTELDLTSALKEFQMLRGPPGAKQSPLRLCKSILRMLWDLTNMIVNCCTSWDLGAGLQESSRPARVLCATLCKTYFCISHQWVLGSIATRYFMHQIRLCYSHMIRYIIIWHVISIEVSLYIYIQPIWLQTILQGIRHSTWWSWWSRLRHALGSSECVNLGDVLWECDRASLEMHLEAEVDLNSVMHLKAVIELVWRCTWRPRWSISQMHLEANIKLNSEMHMEAVIEEVWRCICRPRLCHSEMHLEDEIKMNTEMHLEAVIEQGWRWTWRPWSREFGDTLGGQDHLTKRCTWRPWFCNSEIHLEAVIERVGWYTWIPWHIKIGGVHGRSRFGGARLGGSCKGSYDTFLLLTSNCGNVDSWVQYGPPRDERLAVSGGQTILGCCSTLCILYSVSAVLSVCYNQCMLYSMLTHDHRMER